MTRIPEVQISKTIVVTLFVLAAGLSQAFGWQEKISPVSDYQYKRDYAQFETIKKEADPQKRADLLLAFMKQHPISRMLYYVTTEYIECAKPHFQGKNWPKAIAMTEALQALMPTEKMVRDAGVPEPGAGEFLKNVLPQAHRTVEQTLLGAYYQSNNMQKAAELAEKMYAATPDKSLSAALADIYLKLNQPDKFAVHAEKIVTELPIEQSYTLALQLAGIYQQKNDLAKASGYAAKVMEAFGEKVPQGVQESAWNTSRAYCYGLMGLSAYANKDYPKTIENYDRVTKIAPKSEEAWYYIGMSKWRSQDPEGAILCFAKTAVLGKSMAKKAQEYLEQLYKARHNNTLDGLDELLAKAKSELGVS